MVQVERNAFVRAGRSEKRLAKGREKEMQEVRGETEKEIMPTLDR